MFRHARRVLPSQALPFRNARRLATQPAVTKIEKLVLDNIRATGPLSFREYMQFCLSHPTDGYYMNPANSVFGRRGDFITSPEISQAFGELLGVWFAVQWQNAGAPPSIRLVELGPGRGTLMADILRALRQFTARFHTNIERIHLVETSPTMRELQKQTLSNGPWELVWNDRLEDIGPSADASEYTMLVAHEFFDALPVDILERRQTGWHEVRVDGETTPEAYPRLRRVLSPKPTALSAFLVETSPRFRSIPEGSHLEVSLTGYSTARKIGELLSQGTGSALIVDYGGDAHFGNSFRAFKDHKIVDVFETPGQCDLTANVDFGYLREAMMDTVMVGGPISQAEFLTSMGLQIRVDVLAKAAKNEERKEAIIQAAKRLVDPVTMGREYQVMGITSKRDGMKDEVYPFISKPSS